MGTFAPEFLAFMLRGAQNPVSITLGSEKEATRLRFRLHNMRRSMKKQQHEQVDNIENVSLHVDGNVLTAKPKDQRFVQALLEAGITAEELPSETNATILDEPRDRTKKKTEEEELAEINSFLQGDTPSGS